MPYIERCLDDKVTNKELYLLLIEIIKTILTMRHYLLFLLVSLPG